MYNNDKIKSARESTGNLQGAMRRRLMDYSPKKAQKKLEDKKSTTNKGSKGGY